MVTDNKLQILLQQNVQLFHTTDIAVLWNITNKNTLYTTIKRYTKRNLLQTVQKGLYATRPTNALDQLVLGASIIHSYSYVSTETVLAHMGIINQSLPLITFVGIRSKRFSVGDSNFRVRKLKPEFLYNNAGVNLKNGVFFASTERAIADLLYFNQAYHFDNETLIDWDKVANIQKEVGYI